MNEDKCWAACLGNCEGGLSREHIISKSLFLSTSVEVKGFDWCKDKAKQVGLGALTKRALCRKHNSDLSPIDAAGAYAFGILREQTKLANERSQNPLRKHRRVVFSVNASALEVWLLKTLINCGYGGDYFIGPNSVRKGYPSDDLVEVVFGKRRLPKENGLYLASKVGQDLEFSDIVAMAPLIQDGKYIHGGLFKFRGMFFFLDLVPGGLQVPFEAVATQDPAWHHTSLTKHFRQMKATIGDRVSHVVNFNWK